MTFLNFFFGSKKSSCYTKNPIIDPIFSLDYYFSVLEETKSPLNGFISTQIKKLWVKSFIRRKLIIKASLTIETGKDLRLMNHWPWILQLFLDLDQFPTTIF